MNKDDKSLDQLVFFNRNKKYGAYYLRSLYNRSVMKATIIAVVAFILIFIIPFIINQIGKKSRIERGFVYAVCGMDKPPSDIIILPKSQVSKKISVRENIFREPVIVPSDSVSDSVMFMQDSMNLVKNKANFDTSFSASGNINIDGQGPIGDTVYCMVQINPSFPGGENAMRKFLTENTKYPPDALDYKIQGTVRISFIVETDGSISHIRIKNKIGGGCDEEAVRVVKKMPYWNPGRQKGKNVRTWVVLPFRFELFH